MPLRLRRIAVVVTAALAFATSSPLARVAGGLPPTAIAAGRTLLAALILLAFRPCSAWASYRAQTRRSAFGLFGAGVVLAAHFTMFLGGLATTSFAATVALISLEPLAVVFVAWLAFGLVPTRAEQAGIFLATLGAYVVSRGAGVGEHTLRGDAMVVGAVALYGVYVALARGLRHALPAVPYAAAVYGVASLVLLPFALPAMRGLPPQPASAWVALVLLAVIPTVIGHTLVQVAARIAPPTVVALVSPGETVGSLLIGAVVLGKPPTLIEGVGTIILLVGAVVAIQARGFEGDGAEVVSPE